MTDLQILEQLLNGNHLNQTEIIRAEEIAYLINMQLNNLKKTNKI